MKKFLGLFVCVFVLLLTVSACGAPNKSRSNTQLMPPATNVPVGDAPVGGIPDVVIEQPVMPPANDDVIPGGQVTGGSQASVKPPVKNPNPGGVPNFDDASVACTMDAKICPDGSAVGRTAPDCEFAPCPGE